MSGRTLLAATVALVALGILAAGITIDAGGDAARRAARPAAEALSAGQRDDVRGIVRDYLIANPGVIADALEVLQERQHAAERARSKAALAEHRNALVASADDPVLGPDDASVTMVEFFDYQCPYCKRMTDAVMALLEQDADLRIVFKEFPILGEASVLASRAALAAAKQGKYAEFHIALMAGRGEPTEAGIARTAETVGLDVARLFADMKAPDIEAIVRANRRLAQAIGVTGTPAFVIGDELVPGAVDPARLRELIDKARAGPS